MAEFRKRNQAPRVGFEPTTNRLTAGCSTVELSGKVSTNSMTAQKRISVLYKDRPLHPQGEHKLYNRKQAGQSASCSRGVFMRLATIQTSAGPRAAVLQGNHYVDLHSADPTLPT